MRKHRLRGLAAILLTVLLSGCWTQAGGWAGNTRFNSVETELTGDTVGEATEQWRAPLNGFVTEPIISGDRVYVAMRKFDESDPAAAILGVRAYDRATGDVVWERSLLPTDGSTVTGGDVATPSLEDGALWVPYWHDGLGDCAGQLARLDPGTGAVLTSDPIGAHASAAVIAGGKVATTETDCGTGVRLVVRDLTTRAVVWSHRFAAGEGLGTPTIEEGRLFVETGTALYAFDADGCGTATCVPLWRRTDARPGIFASLRPSTGPGGAVVTIGESAGSEGATVVVRDAATGDIRWWGQARYTGPLPGAITGVAVAYDTIYVAGSQSDPSEFDPTAILDAYPLAGCGQATCAPAWTADLGPTRPSREPSVAGGVVYVPLVATGAVAPAVAAVDAHGCGAATCTELTRWPFVGGSGPFLANTQAYATSVASGRLTVAWLPGLYGTTDTEILSIGLDP